MHNPVFDKHGKMIGWTDEIGGRHEEGCGWNPEGAFCGECSSDTCEGCPSAYTKTMPWEHK